MPEAIVATHYGQVKGMEKARVRFWKGIPFAQPPLGPLRFHAPERPAAWKGVRDALKFGPNAIQSDDAMGSFLSSLSTPPLTSEDCLYLNIWSPAADQQKCPVLVWLHGGAFISGSGSEEWNDGASFARNGNIVVVTLNYRLGALGFLYLGNLAREEYATSNYGLLDQIAALEWVRENIEAFGGDPENVTVAGESAGAMSIGMLLAMPKAKGLFQRAILESGATQNAASQGKATKQATTFLKRLGLDASRVSELTTVPVAAILRAQEQLLLTPVVDGSSLPLAPLKLIANGSASDVSVLIGTNRDEFRLFSLLSGRPVTVDHARLTRLFGTDASEVFATYMEGRSDASEVHAWIDVQTDYIFRIPAIRLAESQLQQNANTWMYRFDWASPAFGGRLGACHALEIPFAWNTLDTEVALLFTGDEPTRQPLADSMHAVWMAFIRTGDPNIAGLPAWPPYTTVQRTTLIFNEECQLLDDPQSTERRSWDSVKME